MKTEARCECGQLKFATESEPVLALRCHCLDCQDALKADFADIAFFESDEAAIEGDFAEKNYTAASGNKTCRQYCVHCNTVLFDRSEGFPGLLGVIVKRLQSPFVTSPSCHVFVRDKQPDVEIPEGIKQFEMGIS